MRSTPQLHAALAHLCVQKPAKLVIDLQAVEHMDSSGLGMLVEILRRVHAYGGKMSLCAASKLVRGMFEITRLDQFFRICATETEALDA